MPNYLLVSIPEDDAVASPIAKVKNVIGPDARVGEFDAPKKLKFGTLNNLLEMSDKLERFDREYQSTCIRLIDSFRDLIGASDNLSEYFKIDERKSTDQYLRSFSWNNAKYRDDLSIVDILNNIAENVGPIDQKLRNQLNQYNSLKNSLQSINRKRGGNLSVRSLDGIVTEDDYVESEYIQTLFVAVPKNLKKDWLNNYETLTDMVIPRSSNKISEDSEYILYSVALMKRNVEEFTNKARDNKFIVRDYKFDSQAITEEQANDMEIEEQEEEKFEQLKEWIQINFSELFSAWIHIKALRVFVESVLRYGISADFVTVLIDLQNKSDTKVIKSLKDAYSYLEDSGSQGRSGSQAKGKPTSSAGNDVFDMHEFSTLLDEGYTPFPLFSVEWQFVKEN
ncbi:Vacuolar ATP synthase subunit C [Mycoemilia scoparia]|uniref:V-type proton ATPase subunit C n=1 Tax=Mycoemilia scoparia TaxID=417184 RepID=A0A9W8A3M5_9FUNG|nr:Vacuolar ATP synthase subunit C [Mycoemilia scoparia]